MACESFSINYQELNKLLTYDSIINITSIINTQEEIDIIVDIIKTFSKTSKKSCEDLIFKTNNLITDLIKVLEKDHDIKDDDDIIYLLLKLKENILFTLEASTIIQKLDTIEKSGSELSQLETIIFQDTYTKKRIYEASINNNIILCKSHSSKIISESVISKLKDILEGHTNLLIS